MIVTIDYNKPTVLRYICGYQGEHNATTLEVEAPRAMTERTDINNYRLIFNHADFEEPIVSAPYAFGAPISYTIPSNLTQKDRLTLELWAEDGNGALLCKTFKVYLLFAPATMDVLGDIPEDNPEGILAEIGANTLARHSHANKAQLDKISENGSGADSDSRLSLQLVTIAG